MHDEITINEEGGHSQQALVVEALLCSPLFRNKAVSVSGVSENPSFNLQQKSDRFVRPASEEKGTRAHESDLPAPSVVSHV